MLHNWPDADKAEYLATRPQAAPALKLRPSLLDWQRQVVSEARRFNVVCVGRRAGKTALLIDRCADPSVLGYPVGWFSPSYKLMLEVWREAARLFLPIIARQNATERRFEFSTGGVLEFWSLDDPQAGRGRKYKRVAIDEAAFVPNLMDAWNYAIRPTLADLEGDAWTASTPKGRNGFWQMYQWGQDEGYPDWRSWQMPSEVNPLIPPGELAEMRRTLPERVAAQELDALFLDDAGGVFRRVMEAATATALNAGVHGRAYIAGVDVADAQDFTVISILDAASREQVYLDRFNRVGYEALEDRLHAAYTRFGVQTMVIEDNSIGQPVIDHLRGRGMNIVGFHTSAATKQPLIQALQSAFEHGAIRILSDPIQVGELQAYESERMAYGFRYGAPPGLHDDCVMSLALAWHGVARESDVVEVSSYVQRTFSTSKRPRR
jgi:hypothetical protein